MSDEKAANRKLRESPNYKYYRVHIDTGETPDLSSESVKLHAITGCYANEYILPATSIGPIFTMMSDESTFKTHACVSVVMMPYEDPGNAGKDYEALLEALCSEYKLNNIHFRDIFSSRILGKRRNDFLARYVEIVSSRQMSAVSFSIHKSDFLKELPFGKVSDNELYFILFWNILEYIVERLPPHSIFHLHFEQENNLSINLGREYIRKLYDGLKQCPSLAERYCSICKHPMFFSKQALFYSSVADLAAYSNNVLQQKLEIGVPPEKIRNNHGELIELARHVFAGYASIHRSSRGAADLVVDKGKTV
jgi:hypothetical protein